MNIFYLDKDPEIAAQMMCDKHVVKMILESAQMLSTAHRVLDGDRVADSKGLYKMAHKNHPSTIWVRTCDENYEWLWNHMEALMYEYTHRYGKKHATERLTHALWKLPINIPYGEFTDPPQCMPDYATWKHREKPEWFNDKYNEEGIRKSTEEKRILS